MRHWGSLRGWTGNGRSHYRYVTEQVTAVGNQSSMVWGRGRQGSAHSSG